jgi:hypothetical protein
MSSLSLDFATCNSQFALLKSYIDPGVVVGPLCTPRGGVCDCGWDHKGKAVGKAPRFRLAAAEAGLLTPGDLWWRVLARPSGNLGAVLGPSELFVVDADSCAAVAEVEAYGGPFGPVAAHGDGRHYYFSRPSGVSGRAIHRGQSRKLDLLATGITVLPPSLHRDGRPYRWLRPFVAPLPAPPAWALDLLHGSPQPTPQVTPLAKHLPKVSLAGLRITPRIRALIRYGLPAAPCRYASRSEALFACLLALVSAGCSDDQIGGVLLSHRYAISEKAREQGRKWLASEIARARDKVRRGFVAGRPGSRDRVL